MLGRVVVSEQNDRLFADFADLGEVVRLTGSFSDIYSYRSPAYGFDLTMSFWREPGRPAEYLVTLEGIAARVGDQ